MFIAGICIILLGGFLFTRYGNERQDYMTNAEVAGVHYLYSIARPGSIFIEGSDGTPWQMQDYEKYNTYSLTDKLYNAVATGNVNAIVQYIQSTKHTNAYLIFTRSQKATAESTLGLPSDALDRLEHVLISSDHAHAQAHRPPFQPLHSITHPSAADPYHQNDLPAFKKAVNEAHAQGP